MDVHRNTHGRHARRGHRVRLVHVPERRDCDQELIPKESTSRWLRRGRQMRRPTAAAPHGGQVRIGWSAQSSARMVACSAGGRAREQARDLRNIRLEPTRQRGRTVSGLTSNWSRRAPDPDRARLHGALGGRPGADRPVRALTIVGWVIALVLGPVAAVQLWRFRPSGASCRHHPARVRPRVLCGGVARASIA
jgi:hypothetical protein